MHMTKSLKKIILYFHTSKIQKYVLACISALITGLLKSWELDEYFKNSKKINFFSFNIKDYELIRKMNPWY
jgi:hypothetical protein